MILLDWWRAWRKPYLCPECSLRCKSKQGMGRHRARHKRDYAEWAKRIEASGGFPIPSWKAYMADKIRGMQNATQSQQAQFGLGQQASCGVSDCKLPMPHTHYQEAK